MRRTGRKSKARYINLESHFGKRVSERSIELESIHLSEDCDTETVI